MWGGKLSMEYVQFLTQTHCCTAIMSVFSWILKVFPVLFDQADGYNIGLHCVRASFQKGSGD